MSSVSEPSRLLPWDRKELKGSCGWLVQNHDFRRRRREEVGYSIFDTILNQIVHGLHTFKDEVTSHRPLDKDKWVLAQGHAGSRLRVIVNELSNSIQESASFQFE